MPDINPNHLRQADETTQRPQRPGFKNARRMLAEQGNWRPARSRFCKTSGSRDRSQRQMNLAARCP